MKFKKKQLDLKEGLKKEWIITNGIGGFASTTVLGANTRRYHGLLVAPLVPPSRRFVVLSKIDRMNFSMMILQLCCISLIADSYIVFAKREFSFARREEDDIVSF